MFTLILVVVLGLIFAIFAGQNNTAVDIQFINLHLRNVPVYAIVLVSFLLGLLISFAISTTNKLFSSLNLRQKDKKIKELETKLKDRKNQLTKQKEKDSPSKPSNSTED